MCVTTDRWEPPQAGLDGHRWDEGKEGWKDSEWEWCWVDSWLLNGSVFGWMVG